MEDDGRPDQLTKESSEQTWVRFSGFTNNRLQRECKVSNNSCTKLPNGFVHKRYSFKSQIATIAPAVLNWNCNR